MTDTLQHDIARYTVAVERAGAWLEAQEAAQSVVGMAPDDFRYPSNLVRGRAQLAGYQKALDGLKAPIAAPDETSLVTKNADFYRTHAERIRRVAALNSPHPLDPNRKPIGMPNRDHATLIEAWPLVGGRWLAVAGLSYMICETAGDFDTAPDAIAAGAETVRSAALEVLSTPDIDQAGERVALAKKTLELCDDAGDWVDMVSQRRTGVAKESPVDPVAETPKPARKTRRGAPDPLTDADRATTLVMQALRDTGRPGAPLPILRVVAAQLTGQRDGAEAVLTMFDGLNAKFECERIGKEPDAWTTRWSRMEGGDIELHDGVWRRVPEPVEADPEPTAPTKLEQLEVMYDKYVAMRDQLDQMIAAEEEAERCYNVVSFNYPVAAKAARKRRDDLDAAIAKLADQIEDEIGPQPFGPPTNPHAVRDILVGAGLATVPYSGHVAIVEWKGEVPAPSRLYRWPVAYRPSNRGGYHDGVYLVTEGMRDHPLAQRIAEVVGYDLPVWGKDMYGDFAGQHGIWHHAVDLATDDHFEHLLDTRHLTMDQAIETAVCHKLSGCPKDLSIKNARKIMAALDIEEPEDRSVSRVFGVGRARGLNTTKGNSITVRPFRGAGWMMIHGIEDKLMIRKGDFLYLSPATTTKRDALQAVWLDERERWPKTEAA